MFSLDNSILLGCIGANVLVDDAIVREKGFQGCTLPPIIDMNGFDVGAKLCFHKREERYKQMLCQRFKFHHTNPCSS